MVRLQLRDVSTIGHDFTHSVTVLNVADIHTMYTWYWARIKEILNSMLMIYTVSTSCSTSWIVIVDRDYDTVVMGMDRRVSHLLTA